MKDFQHEQLFTELTPEQAAVIEGGKTLRLYSIKCLTANADFIGKDEAYFTLGGNKIWSRSMGSDEPRVPINKSYGFEGAPHLALYDADSYAPDDLMGYVGVNGGTGVIEDKVFDGSGSTYLVTYQVLQ